MCYRIDYSRETMRDFILARSLVSQGWSREKSRSRKKPIDTLRDPTLYKTLSNINRD
jgi:hypothetical protein